MEMKEMIIQEFNARIDSLKESFLESVMRLIEESHKKKSESGASSENEKEYVPASIPAKRQGSPIRQKLKKLKKVEGSRREEGNEGKGLKDTVMEKSPEVQMDTDKTEVSTKKYEEKPKKFEEKTQKNEEKIHKYEDKPYKHEEKYQKSEDKSQKHEEKYQKSEDKPQKHEEKYQKSEDKPQKHEDKPQKFEDKPSKHEDKPQKLEEKHPKIEEKYPKIEEKYPKNEEKSQPTEKSSKLPEPLQQIPLKPEDPQPSVSLPDSFENSASGIRSAIFALSSQKSTPKPRALQILSTLISHLLSSNPHTLFHFAEAEAGKALKKLKHNCQDPDLRSKYSDLLDLLMKAAKDSEPQKPENLPALSKQIYEAFAKKNDPELSAMFNKFSEAINGKLDANDSVYVEKIVKIIAKISSDWRNQEIKAKAAVLLAKCNERLPKPKSSESKTHIANRLEGIIPGFTKK